MSEDTANVVYLVVAAIASCTTLAKFVAWQRERSPALRLIAVCSAVGVGAFVFATPVVYRGIAALTGAQNLAELLVFFCILGFFAHTHVMSLVWRPVAEPSSTRNVLVFPLCVYVLVGVAMAAGFLAGGLDDAPHPLDFNIAYGRDPGALVMLAAFQLGLGYASVSTALRFRRNALYAQDDPRLRRALQHIAVATWFIAGYVACVGPATLAGAFGVRALEPLHSLGPVSGTIGAIIINWGFSGAAIATWRTDRRDYLALAPLWQLTRRPDPRIALTEPNQVTQLGLVYVRDWHLVTRMADILSGIRSLYPYFSDTPVDRIRRAAPGAGWSRDEEHAAAAAAVLLRAVALAESGAAVVSERGRPLPGAGLEPAAQRAHLVRMARHLEHPDVLAAAGVDTDGRLVTDTA
ncbi:DUF6545 domain-containing protein [Streptomyces sp. NPDC004126]|uniref:DUF6545 domain-containing protein n=1 Tax=Streptomyces sp. NPDC004126 TaxID=3390695 RepID=UPI003D054227